MLIDNEWLMESVKGDKKKTFNSDAALHIVNRASVDELRRRVWERYPERKDLKDKIYVDVEQFRPNFVVNTGKPFEEDEFCEMRLESCLLRTSGPCIRCNMIRTDYVNKEFCPEHEPSSTLNSFRNLPT